MLTLRDSTEWPIMVEEGTNALVGRDPERIMEPPAGPWTGSSLRRRPALWDGHAGEALPISFCRWSPGIPASPSAI